MNARMSRLLGLLALPALLLAACAPGAATSSAPIDERPMPTSTPVPTDTPVPTQAPTATATPTVTATPLPTSTPTATPLPTATAQPTPTPTPAPGDVLYQTTRASDWKQWKSIYFGSKDFTLTSDGGSLIMLIDAEETWVYAMYESAFQYPDMQVDVDAELISGPNTNNLSVICRYTRKGWYEFNVTSGGLWNIFKFVEGSGYTALKSGGSTAIRSGQSSNHLTAVCVGDSLTLYINGVKAGTVHDKQFAQGTFGVSASTFHLPHVQMRFSNFSVRLADPTGEPFESTANTNQSDTTLPDDSLVGALPPRLARSAHRLS